MSDDEVPDPIIVRIGDAPLPTWKAALISAGIFGVPVAFVVVLMLLT